MTVSFGALIKKKEKSNSLFFLDTGKVFLGVQVPPEDTVQFNSYLEKLGYQYIEETENDVYKSFLC